MNSSNLSSSCVFKKFNSDGESHFNLFIVVLDKIISPQMDRLSYIVVARARSLAAMAA